MSNCCIPGCPWSFGKKKKTGVDRSFFKLYLPKFAKTKEERDHREALRKVVLSLRDPTKGDTILKQLKKESASICDIHFDDDDIVLRGSKMRSLRIGALPKHKLPKPINGTIPRKSPAEKTSSSEFVQNEWQKLFFANQIENSKVCESRRRYHPDVIRWAMELHCRSPAAYEHITSSKVLMLPSSTTLRKYRNFIKNEPGLNMLAIMEIEKIMRNHDYLVSFLTLDEMKIRENLVISDGKIVGFVDENFCSETKLATHILVFYLRSVKGEISFPLAWFPTTVTPAADLALIFKNLLKQCEDRNVQVHAVIADGMGTNRRFFKLISGQNDIPLHTAFTAPNPYGRDRPVLLLSDPPHLLKTVRNGLYSSKSSGTRYMNRNGRDILWTHIFKLYTNEKYSLILRRTKLTENHIRLNPYSRMKVNLAKDVLSWEVAQNLSTMTEAKGTADFVLLMHRWFEIVNCGVRNPIMSMEDERIDELKDFVKELLSWKAEVDRLKQPKRILPISTLEGLIFTTRNIVFLCERLLQVQGYVYLRTFSQDILEGFFSNLRSMGRFSQAPDIKQIFYDVCFILDIAPTE